MAMLGNDPQDMQELISKIAKAIDEIQGAMSTLDSKATSVRWEGPDANRFKSQQWPASKTSLKRVISDLRDVKQIVQKQKQQQIQASS